MKKDIDCTLNQKWMMVIIIFLLFLIVCGSLWDYELATYFYVGDLPSNNLFGIAFSYLGTIPTFIGWSFLAAVLLNIVKKNLVSKKHQKRLKILAYVLLVLGYIIYSFTLLFVNETAFKVSPLIAFAVGFIAVLMGALFGFKCSENIEDVTILKPILIFIIVSFIGFIVISAAKDIMNRPRFRWVMEEEFNQYFLNWWQNGTSIKELFYQGLMDDEFTSFPSGHSACSILAIFLFPLIAEINLKFKKYKKAFFLFGFIFWFLTAFSRLTVGAHYLSDVAFSALIVIAIYELVYYLSICAFKRRGV